MIRQSDKLSIFYLSPPPLRFFHSQLSTVACKQIMTATRKKSEVILGDSKQVQKNYAPQIAELSAS